MLPLLSYIFINEFLFVVAECLPAVLFGQEIGDLVVLDLVSIRPHQLLGQGRLEIELVCAYVCIRQFSQFGGLSGHEPILDHVIRLIEDLVAAILILDVDFEVIVVFQEYRFGLSAALLLPIVPAELRQRYV